MNHFTVPGFWETYDRLPKNVQTLADKNFDLLKANPRHPSPHLKQIGNYWSVRVGIKYRALAYEIEEGLLWFWIGDHKAYDKLIK